MGALFQSTPLMRGETVCRHAGRAAAHISIHSPHARGDEDKLVFELSIPAFQSTPLMRGETAGKGVNAVKFKFQSTPLMRGETAIAR